MPRAKANGIELEYETLGDREARPLLLVSGLGSQLIGWHDELCAEFADRGFYVIRFDNRDAGLSTHMDGAGLPDLSAAVAGEATLAYQLDDMADDAAALLDALDIPAAHVAGASMGGFIAQLLAIRHPARVSSLTSIMSGPAGREGAPATPEAAALLVAPPGNDRESRIANTLAGRRALNGPGFPFDEPYERARAERDIDRAFYPAGEARQLAACLAAHPRLPELRRLDVPALVVHGTADILIPVENGRLVAAAIPGARRLEIEGMGHNLPRGMWPRLVDAVAALAERAAGARIR